MQLLGKKKSLGLHTRFLCRIAERKKQIAETCKIQSYLCKKVTPNLHTSFYCTSQPLHFLQIEILWNPASNKSVGNTFPTAFSHSMSVCYILVILTIFQMFSLLLYLL